MQTTLYFRVLFVSDLSVVTLYSVFSVKNINYFCPRPPCSCLTHTRAIKHFLSVPCLHIAFLFLKTVDIYSFAQIYFTILCGTVHL